MKKRLLLMLIPLVFCSTSLVQTIQKSPDVIVSDYINQKQLQYTTVYAKEGMQEKMTITSVDGEVLELNYKCWVYYIDYTDNAGRYLIVNESNGNLLEVNTKSDAMPNDLEGWRIISTTVLQGDWVNMRQDMLSIESTRGVPIMLHYKPYMSANAPLVYLCQLNRDSISMILAWDSNLDNERKYYFKFSDEQIEIHHFQNMECDFYKRVKGKDYPIEIPFTEYSLVGCQWQWINIGFDKVTIINSNHELGNYIQCDGGYQELDFTKYTLLLARGTGTSGISAFEKQLQQISINGYSLYVDITRNDTAIPQGWFISVKIPKLPQNAVVTLNVNDHH